MSQDLDQLATLAKNGAPGAVESLATKVMDIARRIVRASMNGDYVRSGDDVLGDAMVEAVRVMHDYDGRPGFLRYLRACIQGKVRQMRRRYWSPMAASCVPDRGELDFASPAFKPVRGLRDDHTVHEEDHGVVIDTPNLRRHLVTLLTHLPVLEQQVIIRRYGLYGARRETLREIAESFGKSGEWVRLIEARALERLRAMTR